MFALFLEFYVGYCLNNEKTLKACQFEELMEIIEGRANSMADLSRIFNLDHIKPPKIKAKITEAISSMTYFKRFLKEGSLLSLCIELLCMVVYHKANSLIDPNFVKTTLEEVDFGVISGVESDKILVKLNKDKSDLRSC